MLSHQVPDHCDKAPIHHGADGLPLGSSTPKDESPLGRLRDAINAADREGMLRALDDGADVNHANESGNTPLHWAAGLGRPDLCGLLIERGARVDAINSWGVTPLHDAAWLGYPDLCSMLIERGASLDAKDEEGWFPLEEALNNRKADAALMLITYGAKVPEGSDPDLDGVDYSAITPLQATVLGDFTERLANLLLSSPPSLETISELRKKAQEHGFDVLKLSSTALRTTSSVRARRYLP